MIVSAVKEEEEEEGWGRLRRRGKKMDYGGDDSDPEVVDDVENVSPAKPMAPLTKPGTCTPNKHARRLD